MIIFFNFGYKIKKVLNTVISANNEMRKLKGDLKDWSKYSSMKLRTQEPYCQWKKLCFG